MSAKLEPLAFLLFVSLGGVGGYMALRALGIGDSAAGILAGAVVGLIAIAWVLARWRSAARV